MSGVSTAEIPNRSLFRQPEVCEIAQVQAYVLRSWEAEFPDLGVTKTEGGPRVYRRADVEFVLRIKHLLFVEGLTLAGARRKLVEEQPSAETGGEDLDELLGSDARERIMLVKRGLKEIAVLLAKKPSSANVAQARSLFDLAAPTRAAKKPAKIAKHTKPAKKKK
jgi:DNA-binding transcriptional MerR regulator